MALKQTLIPGTWYKFEPYLPDKATWYMLADEQFENTYSAEKYLGQQIGKEHYYHPKGPYNFCDYKDSVYEPVVGKELAWLRECERQNKFVPIDEVHYEEIINTYSIY